MKTKETNIGATVFGIINKRNEELSNLNAEIEKMGKEIQELETASDTASASGDFDAFKKYRSKLTEARDLKDAYLNRVNYLSHNLPMNDAEADEIKSTIEATINILNTIIGSELKRLAPKFHEIKNDYEKRHNELMDIFNAWNEIARASGHQANYVNPRIIPDIDMILRIVEKYSDKE